MNAAPAVVVVCVVLVLRVVTTGVVRPRVVVVVRGRGVVLGGRVGGDVPVVREGNGGVVAA